MSVLELRSELESARNDLSFGAACAVYHLTGPLGAGKSWLAAMVAAETDAPWLVASSRGRSDEHVAHTLISAMIRGLDGALHGRPGLQTLQSAKERAVELLNEPAADDLFIDLIELYDAAGRALGEVAGLGVTIIIDDVDLAPGASRPAFGRCMDELAQLRVPVLVVLLRHAVGAWRTPSGDTSAIEIGPLHGEEIAEFLPDKVLAFKLNNIAEWSEGRTLDVLVLGEILGAEGTGDIDGAMERTDQQLLGALGRLWNELDTRAWQYLESVIRLGDDASHDAVQRVLRNSIRFSSGDAEIGEAGRSLIDHRTLAFDPRFRLVVGHRLARAKSAARS